jgi:hypothetical protein
MTSDKIDEWVDKKPESWSKLAKNLKQKETFTNFKKKLLQGAKEKGKEKQIRLMTQEQLQKIYGASGTKPLGGHGGPIKIPKKPVKPKQRTITRKGKTYVRTFNPRYDQTTKLSFIIVANLKPRTPEYYDYVNKLVETTGRTKQAIIKKIQRTRKLI